MIDIPRALARLLVPDMFDQHDRLVESLVHYRGLYALASEANRAVVWDMLERDCTLIHRLDQTTSLLIELSNDPAVPQDHRDRVNLHLQSITHTQP